MKHYLKALLLFVVGSYTVLHFTHQDAGWRARLQSATAKKASGDSDPNYNLTDMVTMNRAVVYIEDHYVEPKRINRPKMVASGLEEIEQVVPEVMVNLKLDQDETPVSAEIQVNDHRETFSLKIKSRFELLFKFRDVFNFIQEHLTYYDERRNIEYAAINGMLSTLDPHSVLLTPEEYAEMHLNTRGRFGGLGIVIGVRDHKLTVINPIEDTPAARAGVLANDNIVQINLDSTVNMALSDAVNLMRGEPGTKVDIYIKREGWKSPKKFEITRDNIKVKSVKYSYLGDGIGMARVRNFQNTTVTELKAALEALEREARADQSKGRGKQKSKSKKEPKLRGFILDLRGNPGGLLNQAAKMSDLFIESGTLVKTVGSGSTLQEPKKARAKGTIKELPVVVLLNTQSASASEIVAGALKNHSRALVVGQRSFGKGSVQILFDNPDKSALKLTIAQYLTPGDISIQSVGITPTVELSPVLLTEDTTYFYGLPDEAHGEASLPEHLESEQSASSKLQKPLMTLRYLRDPKLLKEQRDNPNKLIVDFETRFARDVLKRTRGVQIKQLTRAAEYVLARAQKEQTQEIDKTLRPREIQWLSKVTRGRASGQASVTLEPSSGEVKAGESLKVTLTVKNTSKKPLHQVRAITKSENLLFKGHEFLFGHIPPGESRSWTEEIKVGASFSRRADVIHAEFSATGRGEIKALTFNARIKALPQPHFSLRYEVNDAESGNGDGLPNPGEEVELILNVINEGEGASRELVGRLSNRGKGKIPPIFIKRGHVTPETQVIAPQETSTLKFLFKVKEGWKGDEAKAYLSIVDPKLRESTFAEIALGVFTADAFKPRSGQARARGALDELKHLKGLPTEGQFIVRASPHEDAGVLAYLSTARVDGCLNIKRRECEWYRVALESGRFGWAHSAQVTLSDTLGAPVSERALRHEISPPRITLKEHPLTVEMGVKRVKISGVVQSVEPLRDLMIYVNKRKVFFLPHAEMSDARNVALDADVPLEEGVNHITIYARLSGEVSDVASAFVYRPKAENSKNETSKNETSK